MLYYLFYSISLGTLTISIAFNEASNAAINDASTYVTCIIYSYNLVCVHVQGLYIVCAAGNYDEDACKISPASSNRYIILEVQ